MAASGNSGNSGIEVEEKLQDFLERLIFLESPWKLRNFQCNLCDRIAIQNVITNCEDLLCQKCFEIFEKSVCPVCKKFIIISRTTDAKLEEDILNLKVECLNKKHGCQDILILRTFLEHYKQCTFALNVNTANATEQAKITAFQTAVVQVMHHLEKQTKKQFDEFQIEVRAIQQEVIRDEMKQFIEEMKKLTAEIQKVKEELQNTKAEGKLSEQEINENQHVRPTTLICKEKSGPTTVNWKIFFVSHLQELKRHFESQPFDVKRSNIKMKAVAELDEEQYLVVWLEVLQGEQEEELLKFLNLNIFMIGENEYGKYGKEVTITLRPGGPTLNSANTLCQFDFGANIFSQTLPEEKKYFLKNNSIQIKIEITC